MRCRTTIKRSREVGCTAVHSVAEIAQACCPTCELRTRTFTHMCHAKRALGMPRTHMPGALLPRGTPPFFQISNLSCTDSSCTDLLRSFNEGQRYGLAKFLSAQRVNCAKASMKLFLVLTSTDDKSRKDNLTICRSMKRFFRK